MCQGVFVDFHTHFYEPHRKSLKKVKEIIYTNLKPFPVKKAILAVCSWPGSIPFEEICDQVGLSMEDSGAKGVGVFMGLKIIFENSEQIKDVFGNEFTKVGDHIYLIYTPLKYSFGYRKKLMKLWTLDKQFCCNGFCTLFFRDFDRVGSDMIAVKRDINLLGRVGNIFRCDLGDSIRCYWDSSSQAVLRESNLGKFLRFILSQKISKPLRKFF